MARLTALPAQSIVDGFRGVLDYYVWGACRGTPIPCARRWPRYSRGAYPSSCKPPTLAFAWIMSNLDLIPENILEAYKAMASGTSLTWRDVAVRCYLNGSNV